MSMSTFFPDPKKITLRNVEISVSPLQVKNISKAAKIAAPLITALTSGSVVSPALVLDNSDSVISLCALASGQTDDFVGDLNAAELVALLTLIVSVNMDFFSQVIAGQVTNLMKTVQESVITAKEPAPQDGKIA